MTQITTITQPGDIVVVVPSWIVRSVGFLSLFVGLSAAFFMFLAGYITEGLLLAVMMLALVPIGLLFQYLMWRFYWYIVLMALIFQSMCYLLTLIGVAGRLPFRVAGSPLSAAYAAANRVSPVSGMIALLVAALITASLWRIYNLWRDRAGVKSETQPVVEDLDLSEPTPVEATLMDRILKKLQSTGSRGEVKGDTIHVYKGGRLTGIVRVIDREGAISPLILNDVIKQRDRLGVKVAYLATSGMFTADVRNMAEQQGIKLMTV